ncbi:MAG: ABC transporter permease subunit [Proteobacteria bacterium]|nr:ABC transporter permease subunit [Pseudomonadota bacterium]
MTHKSDLAQSAFRIAFGVLMAFIIINVAAIVAVVVVNSFGTQWFTGWLPEALTTNWYTRAWKEFQLGDVLWTTALAVGAVVLLSVLIGVPAAYVLARVDFPSKRLVTLLFLLPLLVPPMTYGIPLATVLYQVNLGGTLWGVILANLVPCAPFVVMVMTPFIEQIDTRVEVAARVFGADTLTIFRRILMPLLMPGIMAAALLVLVRTISMFELTFLTAGADSQTLVVALYYAVFAAGIRSAQSIDAMAVIYMLTTLVWVLIAFRFIDPTQMVGKVRVQKSS